MTTTKTTTTTTKATTQTATAQTNSNGTNKQQRHKQTATAQTNSNGTNKQQRHKQTEQRHKQTATTQTNSNDTNKQPILTSHALSYIPRGQIYSTYIHTVLLYANECWAPNVNDLLKLQRNDQAMIRWTCNVRLKDHISSDSLLRKLGINNIQTLLRYN